MLKDLQKIVLETGEMTSHAQVVPLFALTNVNSPPILIDDTHSISSNEDYQISLQGILLPTANANIPYETVFTSWQEALDNYLSMSEEDFSKLLPKSDESETDKSKEYFLNLSLQQLLDEPIDPTLEKAFEIKKVSSEGGVESLSRVVDLTAENYDLKNDEYDKKVTSIAQIIQFDTPVIPSLSVLQTVITSPQSVSPSTPDIHLGDPGASNPIPSIFESYLNNYQHVEIRGNIFNGPFGYDIHADPGAGASLEAISASFSNSNISGGSISFPLPGELVLTSVQGNTFTFFSAAVAGHEMGDFFFTLNNGIQTPPFASASFDTFVGFIDQYLYGITNNFFNTSVGSIFFKIIDDVPVTHDRTAPVLDESDIKTIGSDNALTTEISVGTLLTDLHPTGTLIITPNLLFNPVLPGVNDNYFGGDGGSVSSIILDNVVGATGVTQVSSALSSIDATDLANFTNFGLTGSNLGDPAILVTLSNNNTVKVDTLTAQYILTLNSALHHTTPDTTADLNFKFTFTDKDGDSSTSTLTFTINDDKPSAYDVSNNIDESALFVKLLTNPLATQTTTGNILTDGINDSVFGADGGKINSLTVGINTITDNGVGDLDLAMGMIQVETTYGSILLTSDGANVGDYTYTLDYSKTFNVSDALGTVDDVIGFQLIDRDNSVANANLTVTIDLNQAPTANDDSGANYTTNEDSILTVAAPGVLLNDTDPNAGDVKKVISIDTTGTLGLVSFNNDGSLSYNPNGQFESLPFGKSATDTFTYTISDAEGLQSTATVTITIEGLNDAPIGTDHTVTTLLEDGTYVFTASDFGFSDPIDSPANTLLAVKIASLPSEGSFTDDGVTVTLNQLISIADINAGLLQFTPNANANGANYASFTFQVQDNGGTTNGGVDLDQSANTMTINVTSVNDAPVGTDNSVTTLEDTARVFTAADFGLTDPNDSPANTLQAVEITTLASAGSLTDQGIAVTAGQLISAADINAGLFQFTPDANANGSGYTSFTFQVQDNGGTTNSGVNLDQSPNTMTINVTAVNDAPAGTDNAVTTLEDTAKVFTVADFGYTDLNDSPANSLLAVEITTLASAGLLTDGGIAVTVGQLISVDDITAGLLQFAPEENANGNNYASFTFQVQDNGGVTNGGIDLDQSANTMTINVTPVNDSPEITNAGSTASYAPTSDPVIIENALDLTDVDNTTLSGATITIDNYLTGDLLTFVDQNGITGSYNDAGLLTLSGNASLVDYQTALDSITYSSTNPDPTDEGANIVRTVSWIVDDGSAQNNFSTAATSTINVSLVPPIVLDLTGEGFNLLSASQSHMTLGDITGSQNNTSIGWIGQGNGLLMLDTTGTGELKSINQISFVSYLPGAQSDLQGLLHFDTNHDGNLDTGDTQFAQFGVLESNGEFESLSTLSISSISLISDKQHDSINGNTIFGYTTFQMVDGTSHQAADVGLMISPDTKGAQLHITDILPTQDQIDFSKLAEATPVLPALANETPAAFQSPAPNVSEIDSVHAVPVVTENLIPALPPQEVTPT